MEISTTNSANPEAQADPSRAVFARLVQASFEHDDVDRLSQAFCLIAAETFGDLCSIQVLNQHNELIHLAGMYDVDHRAESLLHDAVVAMADLPREDGAAGQVILTGEPLFIPAIPEEALRQIGVPEFLRYVDEVGMSTAMAVVLKGRTGNFGVVSLSRHRGSTAYSPADLDLLTRMASYMSVALEGLLLVSALRAELISATSRPPLPQDTSAQPDRRQADAALRAQLAFDRILRVVTERGDDTNPDHLAQAFCVVAAETFGDLCTITLLNQQDELMHMAGLHDVAPQALSQLQGVLAAATGLRRTDGPAARVIRTGEPLLLRSVPQEMLDSVPYPEFQQYIRDVGIGTVMSVALKGRNGNIGAVSLSRHGGRPPYDEDDLALLSDMSARMAVFLGNTLLVNTLRAQLSSAVVGREQATEPVVLARAVYDRLMQAVTEHGDDLDQLSQDIAGIAAEAIGDQCVITLTNPHSRMMRIGGAHNTDPHLQPLLKAAVTGLGFMPPSSSVPAQVLAAGQPLFRKTVSQEDMRSLIIPELQAYVEQVPIGSLMAAPIRGRSGDVGVIALHRLKDNPPFEQKDLELLTGLALRMSVVLENALLTDLLREQADERVSRETRAASGGPTYINLTERDRLETLHRLTHMIGENRERLDRMMELASLMTSETLGGLCTIALLNRHNELLHISAYYDTDPRARFLMGELVKATQDMPRDTGTLARVVQTGQPELITAIDEQQLKDTGIPEVDRFVEEVGVSSTLVVPIKGPNGIAGAISVSRHRGDPPLTETDQSFLMEVGFRLAVAVENRQIIESLRREVAASSSTQQALHVSEQRFRSVFESTAIAIEIMDSAGVIVDVNQAFETLTGFSRADMVGRPYGTLQHPEDIARFFRMLTELKMNRDAPPPIENRMVGKDGSILWVKTHLATGKRPGDNTISFIFALHENITGRKQAEQYFQAVLEATPDALVMVDGQGRIMLVNRQMERLFGYARHELLGQDVDLLVPEPLREQHPLRRGGFLRESQPRPMGEGLELFAVRKDGSELPVEISLSPLQMNGAVVVVAAIRDITERKARQAALVRSERSLAEAQSLAHLGSLEFDVLTGRLEASEEALRILGMRREEVQGSDTVLARMHPEDRQRVQDRTQAVLKSGVPDEFEFRVVRADGSVHIVHDRVAPFFDPQGRPTRILGTVQDITEQRMAEREMVELKSHLQSSVELERLRLAQDLHDGPMQELYGATYRLDELREAVEPGTQSVLQEVNDQLHDTINELRTMAKELRPPAISNFGLEKAIRSYVEDFQLKHPNINLRLSLAKDHQLLPENMRITLFRVFQQALANVIRHSQANEVQVRFSLDAEEARLVVSDNGSGFQVPPNWMSFVRQGHYGLAGAAERVNALGGILLVESQPQQSTTITAVIPWSRSADGEHSSSASLSPQ